MLTFYGTVGGEEKERRGKGELQNAPLHNPICNRTRREMPYVKQRF